MNDNIHTLTPLVNGSIPWNLRIIFITKICSESVETFPDIIGFHYERRSPQICILIPDSNIFFVIHISRRTRIDRIR